MIPILAYFKLSEYILALISAFSFYVWYQHKRNYPNWKLKKKNIQAPPGPKTLPFIGNIHQIGNSEPPYIKFQEFTKEYGPIVSIRLGLQDGVVIDDFELTKELFDREEWCDKYHASWIKEARGFTEHLGILFTRGEKWKETRRFVIKNLLSEFGFGRQQVMETAIESELQDYIQEINEKIEESNGKLIISVKRMFSFPIINIIWNFVAGRRFEDKSTKNDKNLKDLAQSFHEFIKALSVGHIVLVAFPFLRFIFPELSGFSGQRKFFIKCQKLFKETLEERRLSGTYKLEQNNFMDCFIYEIERKNERNNKHFTDEQFMVLCSDLFMAGFDSTSNTLEFAILLIISHQNVKEKLIKELDEVVGRERLPNLADKNHMPYMDAMILEAHRMAAVLPIMLRSPNRDSIVNGYLIKKGTPGLFNTYAIHYSKKIWADPETCRPERFLNAEGTKVINQDKIMPLGFGKRRCIGNKFVDASLFLFLARILHEYTIEASPNHPTPKVEHELGHLLSPKEFKVLFQKRTD